MAQLISLAARFCRLLVLCFLTSALGIAGTEQQTIAPAWRTDLRGALGTSPVPVSFGHVGEHKGEPVTSLRFTDNDTVVATFVTREDERPSLSTRGSDANLPLRLRGIFLNAAAGSIKGNSSWGSESTAAMIVAAHDGKFVTQSGSELTLYGPDLKVLRSVRLPQLPEYEWAGYPSPSGRNILFLSPVLVDRREPRSWIWLETNTLQPLLSWKEPVEAPLTVADDKIAEVACAFPPHKYLPRVQVRDFSGDWRVIATGSGYYGSQFINQDLLGVWGGDLLTLMVPDGKVISSRNLKGAGVLVTSAGGERFVVPIFNVKGRVAALDISGHSLLKRLMLYDIPSHSWSYMLELKGANIRDVMKFALSPNGSRLAVLNNEVLYLFDLPPLPK
jgi:hypothetical protein